jgi:hypothetical protein
MESCQLIQTLFDTHCSKKKKYETDYRIVPLIDELHQMNCLKTIQLGFELCKEFPPSSKTQHTSKKDS